MVLSPLLGAFHDRQMAIVEGTAYGWEDDDRPVAHGRYSKTPLLARTAPAWPRCWDISAIGSPKMGILVFIARCLNRLRPANLLS